jgi:hypothetical protein
MGEPCTPRSVAPSTPADQSSRQCSPPHTPNPSSPPPDLMDFSFSPRSEPSTKTVGCGGASGQPQQDNKKTKTFKEALLSTLTGCGNHAQQGKAPAPSRQPTTTSMPTNSSLPPPCLLPPCLLGRVTRGRLHEWRCNQGSGPSSSTLIEVTPSPPFQMRPELPSLPASPPRQVRMCHRLPEAAVAWMSMAGRRTNLSANTKPWSSNDYPPNGCRSSGASSILCQLQNLSKLSSSSAPPTTASSV